MKKLNKGFTLVELIVVIAVLALLAVVAVVAFRGVQQSARVEAAVNSANTLARHLNLFMSAGEGYTGGNVLATARNDIITDNSWGGPGRHSFQPTPDMSSTIAMDVTQVEDFMSADGYSENLGGTIIWVEYNAATGLWHVRDNR